MTSTRNRVISKRTFYTGFLLAIAKLNKTEFVADGHSFHRAFDEAVRTAKGIARAPRIEGQQWMQLDPVFGVVKEADEMILFGERERLLTLGNPDLLKASFKLTSDEAASELDEIGNTRLFEKMAKVFIAKLG